MYSIKPPTANAPKIQKLRKTIKTTFKTVRRLPFLPNFLSNAAIPIISKIPRAKIIVTTGPNVNHETMAAITNSPNRICTSFGFIFFFLFTGTVCVTLSLI